MKNPKLGSIHGNSQTYLAFLAHLTELVDLPLLYFLYELVISLTISLTVSLDIGEMEFKRRGMALGFFR